MNAPHSVVLNDPPIDLAAELEAMAAETPAVAVTEYAPATYVPVDLDTALSLLWQAQHDYDRALAYFLSRYTAWSAEDVISSRVRRAAVRRLMEMGKSESAADKAATDDEEYAIYRDTLARLLDAKLAAECARDSALAMLITCRVTVEALTALERIDAEGAA